MTRQKQLGKVSYRPSLLAPARIEPGLGPWFSRRFAWPGYSGCSALFDCDGVWGQADRVIISPLHAGLWIICGIDSNLYRGAQTSGGRVDMGKSNAWINEAGARGGHGEPQPLNDHWQSVQSSNLKPKFQTQGPPSPHHPSLSPMTYLQQVTHLYLIPFAAFMEERLSRLDPYRQEQTAVVGRISDHFQTIFCLYQDRKNHLKESKLGS